MPAEEYTFLHEDELWDNFLDLWNRVDAQEKQRISRAYDELSQSLDPTAKRWIFPTIRPSPELKS